MKDNITWVGIDAHKKLLNICVGLPDGTEQAWDVPNRKEKIRKFIKRLEKMADGGEIRCCYEAGPCGFCLKRQLEEKSSIVCEVIAPALIPVKPGDRIKTNRKDAKKLMHLLRTKMLTKIYVPTEQEEWVRDLSRCREDAKQDLTRARNRLTKWLLRRALVHHGTNWTKKHHQWLRSLRFDDIAQQTVFNDYLLSTEQLERRVETLEDTLEQVSKSPRYREITDWLRCFHGIDTITAMGIVTELFDVRRFGSPRYLMDYLGLTSGENSSGDKVIRTGITKAGNCHVRWLLTETAWHYRHRAHVGAALSKRREGQPSWVIQIADKAHHRLSRKFYRLHMRGKEPQKVAIAIARELVGFIWAVMIHWDPQNCA